MCDFSSPRLGFEPGTAASPGTAAKQSAHRLSRRRRRAGGSSFGDSADAPNEAAPFAVSQLTRLSLFTTAASTERRPRRPRLDMPPSSEGEGEGEGEAPSIGAATHARFREGNCPPEVAAEGSAKPDSGSRPPPRVDDVPSGPPPPPRSATAMHGGTAAPTHARYTVPVRVVGQKVTRTTRVVRLRPQRRRALPAPGAVVPNSCRRGWGWGGAPFEKSHPPGALRARRPRARTRFRFRFRFRFRSQNRSENRGSFHVEPFESLLWTTP